MKQIFQRYTFILGLIVLFSSAQTAEAQVYEILSYIRSASTASDQIVDLQEGTLVVKLVSKQSNITAIEDILERDQISPKSRARLKKKVSRLLEDRKKANKDILNALKEYYDFSNYRLMYDTASVHLSSGLTSGYFLNDNLEVDPDIFIDQEKPIYILRYGLANYASTNNFKGLIITDRNHQDLRKPFPYFVKSKYPPFSSVSSFFGQTDTLYPNFAKMISILNQKLTIYYKRALVNNEKRKLKNQIKELKENSN